MTQPLGIEDFFSLEAGEYLARLATITGGPGAPNPEELVRFARALRGSALMAAQQPIAKAAAGLEKVARGFRDGRHAWEGNVAALTRKAVGELQALVDRVRRWSPEEAERAERLTAELEGFVGAPAAAPGPAAAPSDAGLRAFLAREAASVGSVLSQAAFALRGGVAPTEPTDAVLRRMHSLQGMAALADYPPLPDLLDGVERLVQAVARRDLGTVEGASCLDAGAEALARSARDIAERGHPDGEAAEFQSFARRLLAPALTEPPVVPIETLFADGDDGVVRRGSSPRGTAALLSSAAIVSRGERLFQAADDLASATSAVQRDLRLHGLLGELSTLSSGLLAGLDVSVEAFAVAARAAVARGDAGLHRTRYATLLREAGARLRSYSDVAEPTALAGAFDAVTAALDSLGETPAIPAPATPGTALVEAPIVPIESLAPSDEALPIVSIESLLFDEPAPVPVVAPISRTVAAPAAAPAPPTAAAPPLSRAPAATGRAAWDLAASFASYAALLAPAPATPKPTPVAVAPVPVARMPASVATHATAVTVVDISDLLYRGPAALARADLVRREIRTAIAAETPQSVLQPLFEELLDLVELAVAG